MKVVLTNGCFDGFHYGHLRLLQEARKLGDKLIVMIDTDESIKKSKGEGRLLWPEIERVSVIRALSCVDEVRTFDLEDFMDIVEEIKPDVYVKGSDYTWGTLQPPGIGDLFDKFGTEIVFINLVKTNFRPILGILKTLKEKFWEQFIE